MRHNRIAITIEYGCVSLRMRFFSQNFGTIKRILPGSSSPSHREGPGTEVDDESDTDDGETVVIESESEKLPTCFFNNI